MLLGVCAGIARYFGWDPIAVRVAFVVASAAGGVGVVVYALVALLVPAGASTGTIGRGWPTGGPGSRSPPARACCCVAGLLALRATGVWFSDAIVWPLVLVTAGAGLLWRGSDAGRRRRGAAPPPRPTPAVRDAADRAAVLSRTGLGVALVIAAGLVFLASIGALSAARDVVLGVLVAAVVLGVIFAPCVARLARSLSAERAERIRSEERAEMAAHLHDSVLQTLALVQKRADDPREVAALARRQERELRGWLAGRDRAAAHAQRCAAALEAAASEIEDRARRARRGRGRRRRARSTTRGGRSSPPPARRWSTPPLRRRVAGRRLRRGERDARRGLRPRPRPGLRPRRRAGRPARRARVDRRAHGAPRRARRRPLGAGRRHRGRAVLERAEA